MIYQNVPYTINKMCEVKGDSLHAMSMRAGIAYPTVHSWKTGKAVPNVDKFKEFLIANDFDIKIVMKS